MMFIQLINHVVCAFQTVLARFTSISIAYWQHFKRIRAQGGLSNHNVRYEDSLVQIEQLLHAKHQAEILKDNCELQRDNALIGLAIAQQIIANLNRGFKSVKNSYELLQTDAGEAIYKYDFIRSELQTLEHCYESTKSELADAKKTLAESVNLAQPLYAIKREWLKKKIDELRQRCFYQFDDSAIRNEVLYFINEHRSEFTAIDIEVIKTQSLALFVENWQSFDEMERLRHLRSDICH